MTTMPTSLIRQIIAKATGKKIKEDSAFKRILSIIILFLLMLILWIILH